MLTGQTYSVSLTMQNSGSTTWSTYKVSAAVKNMNTSGYARVLARYRDNSNFYACGVVGNGTIYLGKMSSGTWSTFSTVPYAVSPTTFYRVAFTVNGSALTCTVTETASNRTATVSASATDFGSGAIGAAASGNAEFDNFSVVSV